MSPLAKKRTVAKEVNPNKDKASKSVSREQLKELIAKHGPVDGRKMARKGG